MSRRGAAVAPRPDPRCPLRSAWLLRGPRGAPVRGRRHLRPGPCVCVFAQPPRCSNASCHSPCVLCVTGQHTPPKKEETLSPGPAGGHSSESGAGRSASSGAAPCQPAPPGSEGRVMVVGHKIALFFWFLCGRVERRTSCSAFRPRECAVAPASGPAPAFCCRRQRELWPPLPVTVRKVLAVRPAPARRCH